MAFIIAPFKQAPATDKTHGLANSDSLSHTHTHTVCRQGSTATGDQSCHLCVWVCVCPCVSVCLCVCVCVCSLLSVNIKDCLLCSYVSAVGTCGALCSEMICGSYSVLVPQQQDALLQFRWMVMMWILETWWNVLGQVRYSRQQEDMSKQLCLYICVYYDGHIFPSRSEEHTSELLSR